MEGSRGIPLWLLLLLGWCAARALGGVARLGVRLAGAGPAGAATHMNAGELVGAGGAEGGAEFEAPDPRTMAPRELRRLPGIGENRANAIARARWERGPRGPPLLLSDLPGIGPDTEALVRRWLEERGWRPRDGIEAKGGVDSTADSPWRSPPQR